MCLFLVFSYFSLSLEYVDGRVFDAKIVCGGIGIIYVNRAVCSVSIQWPVCLLWLPREQTAPAAASSTAIIIIIIIIYLRIERTSKGPISIL